MVKCKQDIHIAAVVAPTKYDEQFRLFWISNFDVLVSTASKKIWNVTIQPKNQYISQQFYTKSTVHHFQEHPKKCKKKNHFKLTYIQLSWKKYLNVATATQDVFLNKNTALYTLAHSSLARKTVTWL